MDSRRRFLTQMIAAHAGAQAFAQSVGKPVEFRRIRLEAAKLDELAGFYSKTLGLPVKQSVGIVTVQAGRTALEFAPARDAARPFYHFAFNIPENKLAESMDWLRPRCPILHRPNSGGEIYHFANWNAHSCYFADPAGNLLEFIARHTLRNGAKGSFRVDDILSISEIGLVAPEVSGIATKLKSAFGVDTYVSGSDDFHPVGNEHGLFILVRTGRSWGIINQPAAIYPVSVSLAGATHRKLDLGSLPYVIET